jgi:hypothetical protein
MGHIMSLQGNLTDLPLIDLLQIFSVQNKRGALLINQENLEGRIYFAQGGLWAALVFENSIQGTNTVSCGEEAIYMIMDWQDGVFYFDFNNLPLNLSRNVFVNYNYLILEQCRRQDEQERLKRIDEVAGRIPHLVPNPPTKAEISLNLEEWRILLQVNGVSTVTTIANNTRQTLEEIVGVLDNLQAKGLIELTNIAKFTQKKGSGHNHYPNAANQPVYYQRAVGDDGVPPTNLYNLPAQKRVANPVTSSIITNVPPVQPTYAKPKVQKGILSGIMAKIRGL